MEESAHSTRDGVLWGSRVGLAVTFPLVAGLHTRKLELRLASPPILRSQHGPEQHLLWGVCLSNALQGLPTGRALSEQIQRVRIVVQELVCLDADLGEGLRGEREHEDRLLDSIPMGLENGGKAGPA